MLKILEKIKQFKPIPKISRKKTGDTDIKSAKFNDFNKKYYQKGIENYDWTEATDNFKGLETFFHRKRQKLLLNLIEKFGKGEKYLDAGCGSGLITRHLPVNSIGLDINPRNVKRAKKYAPLAKIVEADIENMPFIDNYFSTIICSEVLEHIPNPQRAISEIKRVLEPGGILIGTVPQKNFLWKLRVLSSTHPGEPYHKEYRKSELIRILSDFEIIKIFPASYFMTLVFIVRKKSQKIKEVYEQVPPDYYDVSIKNNLFQRYWHLKRFKVIGELAKGINGKILDIGCDGGTFTKKISDYTKSKDITGIDIYKDSIEYASKKYPDFKFIVADCNKLPFKNETFDLITSLEVLEHIQDVDQFFKEAKRCLKKDGFFIILVPNENFLFQTIWFFWIKLKGKVWKDAHIQKLNKKKLIKVCEGNGFEVIKTCSFHLGMLIAVKLRLKIDTEKTYDF